MKVHQRYEWTYLYAFAHPNSGEVHWLILPTVSARVFSLALENFAREVGAGKKKTHPAGGRQGRLAHGEEGSESAGRYTP